MPCDRSFPPGSFEALWGAWNHRGFDMDARSKPFASADNNFIHSLLDHGPHSAMFHVEHGPRGSEAVQLRPKRGHEQLALEIPDNLQQSGETVAVQLRGRIIEEQGASARVIAFLDL